MTINICNNCSTSHNDNKCPTCGSPSYTVEKVEDKIEVDKYITEPFPHITKELTKNEKVY